MLRVRALSTMAVDLGFPWRRQLEKLNAGNQLIGHTGKVFEDLASLSTRRNIHFIRCLMMDMRPRRTLEVGLAFGGSALAIAACHRECGNDSRAFTLQLISLRQVTGITWKMCNWCRLVLATLFASSSCLPPSR